jgi:methylphosphotriester-DNA--protein-cysteine methyltransferase
MVSDARHSQEENDMKPTPSHIEMDRAFRSRDGSYDGIFYIGVRTTGVFCRPSCPARKPLPRNVEFFPTTKQALFAGYRPCKRCEPLKAGGELPAWAVPLLDRGQHADSGEHAGRLDWELVARAAKDRSGVPVKITR